MSEPTFDRDFVFDLLRGVAAYTHSDLIANLAATVSAHPAPDLAIAFNHKQIASKLWLKDSLFETLGGSHPSVMVLGGWYGVLAALLFDDPRYSISSLKSVDRNPACADVARSLNREMVRSGRFEAVTAEIENLEYDGEQTPDLVINTSCEHIADLDAALRPVPQSTHLVLQSNDYRREPDHVACVDTLDEFEAQAKLAKVLFRGALATKNYTRFMLIGTR